MINNQMKGEVETLANVFASVAVCGSESQRIWRERKKKLAALETFLMEPSLRLDRATEEWRSASQSQRRRKVPESFERKSESD